MAEIPYQVLSTPYDGPVVLVLWEGLTAGDTGQPFSMVDFPTKTVMPVGTFGGTITFELSFEPVPTVYATMRTTESTNMAFTSAIMRASNSHGVWMRPNVGVGVVDVDVYLVAHRILLSSF